MPGPASPPEATPAWTSIRRWRKIVAILLVPVVCCLALAVLCMIFEEQFIFFPSRYPQGDWNPAGLKFEDAQFTASDGTPLHGWYVPHENPRAVVLFSHGNAGNLSDRAEMLRALNGRAGVSVMIYDYRGYGKSGGRPAEKGLLLDARAVVRLVGLLRGSRRDSDCPDGPLARRRRGRRPGRHGRCAASCSKAPSPPLRRWPPCITPGCRCEA